MESLVVILAIVTALEPAAIEQQALQHAVASSYQIDRVADEILRRHTTEAQRRFVGNAALITRIAVERKVTYEWKF